MAESEDLDRRTIIRRLAGLKVKGKAQKRADRAIAKWRAGQLTPRQVAA